MTKKPNVAVMASGKGSNLQVILEAVKQGACPVNVQLVIANKEDAGALSIARLAEVPCVEFVNPKQYADRDSYDQACAELIESQQCEWIVLAGYMRILSSAFVQRFAGRIINIHPSLLPAFAGPDGAGDALAYGVKVAGCTVHLVDEVLDGGPILAQASVPVLNDDSRDSLHARIQEQEHQLYPDTLRRMVEQGFELDGRRVVWKT